MRAEAIRAPVPELRSLWTPIGGLKTHARVFVRPQPHEYPPVVFVHGIGVSSRYMVPIARHLAAYCSVYALDLPGFGKSDHPPTVLNVRELAEALGAWLDSQRLENPVLFGNSFGCQIIAELASREPHRLSRAVLQGPTMDPQGRTVGRALWRWALGGGRERVGMAPLILLDYWDATPWRVIQTFRLALQDRIEEKLPRMRVPTLVVWGTRDTIVSRGWAEEATRLLPDGRLVIIPGVAHTINFSAPVALTRVVLPFLRGESVRSAA